MHRLLGTLGRALQRRNPCRRSAASACTPGQAVTQPLIEVCGSLNLAGEPTVFFLQGMRFATTIVASLHLALLLAVLHRERMMIKALHHMSQTSRKLNTDGQVGQSVVGKNGGKTTEAKRQLGSWYRRAVFHACYRVV